MKLLFINAPGKWAGKRQLIYPLGLAYVATYLKERLDSPEIHFLDLNMYKDYSHVLERAVKEFSPEIVGIEFRNAFYFSTPQASLLKDTVDKIKLTVPDSKVIIGGSGFSLFAEDIMKYIKNIDFGIFGEGEVPFWGLINSDFRAEKVKNVFFRNNNEIIYSGHSDSLVDPEELSVPKRDWDGLDLSKYNYHGFQTKRGCSFRCDYCPEPFLQGKYYRLYPLKRIKEELAYCVSLGIDKIFFVDTIFNLPLRFSMNVLDVLSDFKGVEFSAFFKVTGFNQSYINKLEETGFKEIYVSLENVDPSLLELNRTGINERAIEETTRLLYKSKLKVRYQFILGLPHEDFANRIKNMGFMLRLMVKSRFKDRVFAEPLAILPYTELIKRHNIEIDLFNYPVFMRKLYWWYFPLLKIIQKMSDLFKLNILKLNKFK
ncbi:MAG: cobalamin-dependent protein [Deltaproteobacteria bacterium]|nr:cobalamin-dependent protein [Deltaproteobacteria bacterium]MCL5277729.1 cobalamin-dependent protein [Deltaproteobacteria bacterium]